MAARHASASRHLAARLAEFVRQRFPVAAYCPLILVFVAAGFVPAAQQAALAFETSRFLLATLAVTAAFLHLRIADELKDAEIDRLGRPDRPLPSGLVSAAELRSAALVVIVLGIALTVPLGPPALVAYAVAVGFMALADIDFGAGARVHRNLLVYALVHSPIVPLLLVFSWLAAGAPAQPELLWLVLLSWSLGLGLEIARKTRAAADERAFVETYSAVLGQRRATLLAGFALMLSAAAAAGYAGSVGATWAALVAAAATASIGGATIVLAGRLAQRSLEAAADLTGLLVLGWPTLAVLVAGRSP